MPNKTIKICQQINENECGCCVLTSFVNFFNKNSNISKQDILNKWDNCNNGMSLFDFEIISRKFGLQCESYQVTWQEFCELKFSKPIACLIKNDNNNQNHYIIIEKKKNYLIIYDSCYYEPVKISYSEFEKKFINIIILIEQIKNHQLWQLDQYSKTQIKKVNIKFLLISIFISCVVLGLSFACSSFLNFIIDLSIAKNSFINLLTIGLIYFFVNLFQLLGSYITNLLSQKMLKEYLLYFTSLLVNNLSHKSLKFINKVDSNWFFKMDQCILTISNYFTNEVTRLITNCIFIVVYCIILCVLQYFSILFVLCLLAIELVVFLLKFNKKQKIQINILRCENKNSINYYQLCNYFKKSSNFQTKNLLIQNLKINYSNIYKNFNDLNLHQSSINIFETIFKKLCEICLIVFISYVIMKYRTITIGSLTFIISCFSLLSSSITNIFSYFLNKVDFDIFLNVFNDFINVDNLSDEKFNLDYKNILISSQDEKIELIRNKNIETSQRLFDIVKNASSIKMNNVELVKNNDFFNNLVIVDENFSEINKQLLLEKVDKEPIKYLSVFKKFDFDINNENYQNKEKCLVNILNLIDQEDKIIIFDKIFKYFSLQDINKLEPIINQIGNKNYVYYIKEKSCTKTI